MNNVLRATLLHLLLTLYCACYSTFVIAASEAEVAREKRCPEGRYQGRLADRRTFMQDPYIWFISREFANRFCFPEEFIDNSLKGALAIAVRLKPKDEVTCGLLMGRGDQCPVKQQLLMDVFIDTTKAEIPKADPSVTYFSGRIFNAGWIAGAPSARADRREKGEITELEGERRPFSPYSKYGQGGEGWTRFAYLGVRDKWASSSGVFIEEYYRKNWANNIDLITLNPYLMGFQELRNPDLQVQIPLGGRSTYPEETLDRTNPIQKWAIGIITGKELRDDYKNEPSSVPYPSGYSHVIEIPHKIAQIIYKYDWQQGAQFFNDIQKSLSPAANPSK